MSHSTLANQGIEANGRRDWPMAVAKLTQALRLVKSPLYLIARSKAFVGAGQPDRALADAELAWHTAYDRGNRKAMAEAQYRRAVAFLRLGLFANADCCCVWSMRLCEGFPAREPDPQQSRRDSAGLYDVTPAEATARTAELNRVSGMHGLLSGEDVTASDPLGKNKTLWNTASCFRVPCLTALQKLAPDQPARKVTASLVPVRNEDIYLADDGDNPNKAAVSPTSEGQPKEMTSTVTPGLPVTAPPTSATAKSIRIQDFQTDSTISISIFTKGVSKDTLNVHFTNSTVTLDPVRLSNGLETKYDLSLWGQVIPSECTYLVTPSKIEVSLKKLHPGRWKQSLADTENAAAASGTESDSPPSISVPVAEVPTAQAPGYPTSSKSGPKNWDKLASAGDKDDADENAQDVNFFFKQIYSDASPEQQRAMTKSFVESNGTALSTDWADVKSRTVPTHPPDGVEAKKWTQ